jgi:hypothetical protein
VQNPAGRRKAFNLERENEDTKSKQDNRDYSRMFINRHVCDGAKGRRCRQRQPNDAAATEFIWYATSAKRAANPDATVAGAAATAKSCRNVTNAGPQHDTGSESVEFIARESERACRITQSECNRIGNGERARDTARTPLWLAKRKT